mgnify:CR=1 FL=1
MKINQFKKYLLAKNKNTLVELYLQKCFDSEAEKTELVKEIAELKNDIKMLTNNYVNLLLLDRDK